MRQTVWILLLLCVVNAAPAAAQTALMKNGGFEGGAANSVPEWQFFESGYETDRNTHRNGDQSIRCDSANLTTKRGAQTKIILNQKMATSVLVTGWSKADAVSGIKNSDYSLYIDLEYMDGTTLWGQTSAFRTGTHDWERRQLLVIPVRPVKFLWVFALFRNHSGTAWFDDFYARDMAGANLFDSQDVAPPVHHAGSGKSLRVAGRDGLNLDFSAQGDLVGVGAGGNALGSGAAGGFFVRDVAADGPLVPLRGTAAVRRAGGINFGCANGDLHLRFNAKIYPEGDHIAIDGELNDTTKRDRAISVYFVLPVNALGWQWGRDIRHSETIAAGREFSNSVRVNVGANGGMSLYPFACVANEKEGVGFSNQMDWPSVYRIFYNANTKQFVIGWDFALTPKTATWPSSNARFRCTLFGLNKNEAAWGFRAAAQKFYNLNKAGFTRRAKAEGIWMPFTDPAKVEHPEDFSFAYHEGDNSIKSDDALNILSFRYTEPSSYWLPMPPEMPRTYENALALIKRSAGYEDTGKATAAAPPDAKIPTAAERNFARAVLNSGTQDEDGKFNLEFQNQPWANGAVFTLNPNAELPVTPDKPTKASLSYNFALATQMYGKEAVAKRGTQDGEYLDSLEAWTDVLDYRPLHLQTCPYPIPFDTDNRRPTVPQWFAVHTFARYLRDDLHNRDKLLFANSSPIRFSIFAPLLDVAGIEVNWLDGKGNWQPDSDETMNLRRTLSGKKPYLLLMNSDYNKFNAPLVERYIQRCLFYGIYPSMFSANAANAPYWENPAWYNRDRPTFKRYLPILKTLSAAGWEPVPFARSSDAQVFVERFGTRHFTLRSDSAAPKSFTLSVEIKSLGITGAALHIRNLMTGTEIPAQITGDTLKIPLTLNGDEVAALEILSER